MRNFTLLIFLFLYSVCTIEAQNIAYLSPSGDTYADGGSSQTVFNTEQPDRMWIKTGSSDAYTRVGFIKFDISGLTIDQVATAKLRLFCYETQSTATSISVFGIDQDWEESTLTWDNRPELVIPPLTSAEVVAEAYMEWNISRYVQQAIGDGKTSISLGLSDVNGDNKLVRFYTKESTNENKPQLKINDQVEDFQALEPVDDAMVQGGKNGDNNYSSGTNYTQLMVKEGSSSEDFARRAFLKFDLKQLDRDKVDALGTVRLKLHFFKTNNSTPKIDLSLLPVSNSWEEETVTWNTAPEILDAQSIRTTTIDPDSLDQYYTWDITQYVEQQLVGTDADSIISISVRDLGNSNNGATFYSKEATDFHPMLELLKTPTDVPPAGDNSTGIFYVDAENGKDEQDGLSPQTAWKSLEKVNATTLGAGARILFKSGQSWTGTLKPLGSGEEGKPIVIGSYGAGNKPIINGAGAPETIHLNNMEYVELRNLEITNYDPSEEGGISMAEWEAKNSTEWFENPAAPQDETAKTSKMGIRISAQDLGEVNHIYMVDLKIHGINGDNRSKNNGGIYMEITGNLVPTYFNDLLIEGCYIHDVDRTGVYNVSTWEDRTIDTNDNWTPTLNYNVRHNVFERTGANALVVRVAKDPMIEHNLFHQCAIKESGNATFNFNTDGAIFQYNEARFTKANVGDVDAGGLDSDFRTKNTILQYNYVHDNDYGMLATGGGFNGTFNDNTIFRYNIIERDGLVARENGEKYAFKVSGQITNTTFHNNVIYLSPEQEGVDIMLHKLWRGNPNTTSYYNNIYYLEGENHGFDLGNSKGNTFQNNLFFAKPSTNLPPDPNAVKADPLFVNVGGGPEGFKLMANSPAIGAGRALTERPSMDYFGNPLPAEGALDIGVQQYTAAANANTPGGFAKSDFDIYLLIGQSNMAGRGDIGALDEVVLDSTYLYNATGWEKASVPLNKYSTVFKRLDLQKMNPGYTFARKLNEYTGKGVGLVVNARGGTSINEWMKGYDGATDLNLYEEAVARLKEAMKDGNFKGILWHQGESDQGSTKNYMDKLKQLVADLRNELGQNTYFVAGELGKWRDSSEDFNAVIQNISNDINQADYVSAEGLMPINQDFGDPHFDGFSQRVLGGLYADRILENVYNLDAGVASLYSECDYKGYKVAIKAGIYTLDELAKRGVRDNDLSSIKLDTGYEARLLKSADAENSVLIESSTTCLENTEVANDVSYVLIGKTGTTGGMLSVKKIREKGTGSNSIIVSPNPAKNRIRISLGSGSMDMLGKTIIQLADLQGRMIPLDIKKMNRVNNAYEYNLSNHSLSSGVYILSLQSDIGLFTAKLVIR